MALLGASRSLLQLAGCAPAATRLQALLIGINSSSKRGYAGDTSPSIEGTTDPLTTKIMAEHGRIEKWFKEYERPDVTPQCKLRLGWEIIRALSIHAAKEEMVLYPTVAQHFGPAAADKLVDEHQTLKNTLYEMDGIDDPKNPRLDELVQKTIQVTRHHVRDEEENFLPKLAKTVGPAIMEQLALKYESARLAAPTRPHPTAPNRPPLNIPANTTAVALDMARDAIRFGPGDVTGDVEDHGRV